MHTEQGQRLKKTKNFCGNEKRDLLKDLKFHIIQKHKIVKPGQVHSYPPLYQLLFKFNVFIGQRILIFKLLTQLSSLSCFHYHQKHGFAIKARLTILWLMDEAKWNPSTLKMKASGTLEIGYSLIAQENNFQNRIPIFSPWINQLYSAERGGNIFWLGNVQLRIHKLRELPEMWLEKQAF